MSQKMKPLRAYHVYCETNDYGQYVVYHYTSKEANKFGRKFVDCEEFLTFRCKRYPQADMYVTEPYGEPYLLNDDSIYRNLGWRRDDDSNCHQCGLYSFGIERYETCSTCNCCYDCGCRGYCGMYDDKISHDEKNVIVMVGCPASGKSTWITDFLNDKNGEYKVASTDNLIEEYASSKGLTYNDVFRDYITEANKILNSELIPTWIKEGKSVIYDQTNMSAKKRAKIINRFKQHGYKFYAVNFEVDINTIKRRNQLRFEKTGKHIPEYVINNMIDSYDEVKTAEGFDYIFKLAS